MVDFFENVAMFSLFAMITLCGTVRCQFYIRCMGGWGGTLTYGVYPLPIVVVICTWLISALNISVEIL